MTPGNYAPSEPARCRNCQTDKQVVYANLQCPASPVALNLIYTPLFYCWECLNGILNQEYHMLAANHRPPRQKAG